MADCTYCYCGGYVSCDAISMATSVPNPAVCQSTGGTIGDGGAGALSGVLNTIGKWGTAITGVVAGSKVQGAAIQARAQTKVATQGIQWGALVIIVLAALVIYLVAR